MANENKLRVFEIWVAYGDSGIIQEGVLILPCPSSSSSKPKISPKQRPTPYFFHTTYTPSPSSASLSQPSYPPPSSIGGKSIWQGNILASSLPQYLRICASVTSRHTSPEERESLKKPAEWTKMLFLDLAREGIWVESVLSVGRVGGSDRKLKRTGEWEIDGRSRRREIQRPITCDAMMLRRLSRRFGSEHRERGRKRRNRNIVDGIRRRRSRRIVRPKKTMTSERMRRFLTQRLVGDW